MVRYQSGFALIFSAFLLMLGVGAIVALLPQRVLVLSGSVSTVGYLASAYAAFFIALQIPLGRLADRFGFKPFLVAGYCFCAAAGCIYYYSELYHLILVGRMLQGIGEAPILSLAPAMLAIIFPLSKGRFMGMYNASIHLGLTIGSIMGYLLHPIWKGGEAFLLFTGLSLLGGVVIALFVKSPERKAGATIIRFSMGDLLSFCRGRTTRVVLAGILLYGAGYGIFMTIVPAFLITRGGNGPFGIGAFFALFFIALCISQLVAGPLSDRLDRKTTMAYGMLAAALGTCSIYYLEAPWLYWSLALSGLGFGVFCISAMAFLQEIVPDTLKGTVSGTIFFTWGAGYFFGPLVLAKTAEGLSLPGSFIVLAGLFTAEFVALVALKPNPQVSVFTGSRS
jgi:MFS family permease